MDWRGCSSLCHHWRGLGSWHQSVGYQSLHPGARFQPLQLLGCTPEGEQAHQSIRKEFQYCTCTSKNFLNYYISQKKLTLPLPTYCSDTTFSQAASIMEVATFLNLYCIFTMWRSNYSMTQYTSPCSQSHTHPKKLAFTWIPVIQYIYPWAHLLQLTHYCYLSFLTESS